MKDLLKNTDKKVLSVNSVQSAKKLLLLGKIIAPKKQQTELYLL